MNLNKFGDAPHSARSQSLLIQASVLTLLLATYGCGADNVMGGSQGGTGGTRALGIGGATARSGGAMGTTGGKANAGNTGGANATGGATATGGANATGGATAMGQEARSLGCGKAGVNVTARYVQLTVDGTARQYYLSFPQAYDPNKAYSLVFAFHGGGGNGESFRGYSGVEDNSGGNAIFAYPDGLNGVWDLEKDGNDHKLDDAIFESVRSDYCIDENAVFAFGFSYGGWAATEIACARPALVKGIMSVAGGGPQGSCAQAVPAMIVHATNDGAEKVGSGRATVTRFKEFNACGDAAAAATPDPCVSYAGCTKALLWCEHGGGHNIPEFAQKGAWGFFSGLR